MAATEWQQDSSYSISVAVPQSTIPLGYRVVHRISPAEEFPAVLTLRLGQRHQGRHDAHFQQLLDPLLHVALGILRLANGEKLRI